MNRNPVKLNTDTYLKEEVAAEGLVRDIGPFAKFLDIAAANNGETVNFNNIARECAVSVKTVQQLGGMKSFLKDNPDIPAYVLGAGQSRRRLHDDITVINWDEFILEELEVLE